MNIKAKERRIIIDYAKGKISLREAQRRLKVLSMSSVYTKAFAHLKELLK